MAQAKTTSRALEESERRFPLFRYFLAAGLLAISAVTVVTAITLVQLGRGQTAQIIESRHSDEAVHFSAIFYEEVWSPQQRAGSDLTIEELEPSVIHSFADTIAFGLNILGVSVLDLSGQEVFSNVPLESKPGERARPTGTSPFVRGVASASLQRDQQFVDLDGVTTNIDVVTTLVPLVNSNPKLAEEGSLVGILEIVADVTPEVTAADRTASLSAIAASVGMGTTLMILLSLIVYRADRLIGRSHGQLLEKQRAAEESEERYRGLFQGAPIAYFNVASDGTIVRCNSAAGALVGRDPKDLEGQPVMSLYADTPDGRPKAEMLLQRHLQGERLEREWLEMKASDGRSIWISLTVESIRDDSGNVVESRSMAIDITDRKKAEEQSAERTRQLEAALEEIQRTQSQLIQSAKLAAVGELVSGVAHELNNPLTGILGLSDLLMDAERDESKQRELEMINSEAKRSIRIVQNLLAFARPTDGRKTPTALNELVDTVVELRAYEQNLNNIHTEVKLSNDLPLIHLDGDRIQQVLLNLVVNAEQAIIGAHSEGRIVLSTYLNGDSVRLEVKDDGPGIPLEIQDKIFDPFFTTKDVGKGSGLGLSICYGIIQEHGGRLSFASQPGQGTAFFIDLPVGSAASPSSVEVGHPSRSQDRLPKEQ